MRRECSDFFQKRLGAEREFAGETMKDEEKKDLRYRRNSQRGRITSPL